MHGDILAYLRRGQHQKAVEAQAPASGAAAPAGVADRLIFMDHGQILEMGKPDTLFNSPRHPRLRQFLTQIL